MTRGLVWLAAAVLGAAAVVASLNFLPSALRRAPHARPNFRGREVIGTAGIVLDFPLAVGAIAALVIIEEADLDVVLTMLVAGKAFALLGYLDDVYGSRHAGGFVGHARELLHGRFTTGSMKAIGGAVVGLLAAWGSGRRGLWILAGGAIVALSANLSNLLDVRPGRTTKVWLPCAVGLVVAGMAGETETTVVALGAGAIVFLVYELRERVMLGDTGAGLLGGVLGVAAISSMENSALIVLLAVLLALTAASEVVSFTRVIEATPPLRWVDRLGRQSPGRC